MPLLITGISHHTATLEIREKIAVTRLDYAARLKELLEFDGVEEAVIVVATSRKAGDGCLGNGLNKIRSNNVAAAESGHLRYQQTLQRRSLTDLEPDGCVNRGVWGLLHHLQNISDLTPIDHIDIAGFLEPDREGKPEGVGEVLLTFRVAEIGDEDPVALGETK